MKQIRSKRSIIMLLIIALMSMNVYAQNQTKKKQVFVRVYDFNGKKVAKGHFNFATDSILELRKSNQLITVPIKEISKIKTKRSNGHNMLVHTAIGTAFGVVLGAVTASPDKELWGYSAGEGALIGSPFGALVGAGVGGITIATKKSKTYIIDGDLEMLNLFINDYK